MSAYGPPSLFGRERELVELHAALRSAESGKGTLVLLVGEPGIGKTRLAQAGEARLRRSVTDAGFARVRRATETPFNLVLEAKL